MRTGDQVGAVWLRVRAGLRQDWRGTVVLALITAVIGGVVLAALAGARRTDTAVSRFLTYSGPTEASVTAPPGLTSRIAALPGVAYSELGSLMLALPVTASGRLATVPGQVLTWAMVHRPPQARSILVAGRLPAPSRVTEVAINEMTARVLHAH
ncbi:MAG TPA: hypothetical protein VE343_14715, partial [Streptosporangiaceae bacterium]|nr:hypothetical protein [Streptosporangiaceae bacterium]